MTPTRPAARPDVLVVVWQVDRDPWRSIASEGQMQTWLRVSTDGVLEGSGGRILVRHALGRPAAAWAPRVDAWNSRMRWHHRESVRRLNAAAEWTLGLAARRFRPQRLPGRQWFGQPAWSFDIADIHLLWRWKFIVTVEAALATGCEWIFFTTSSSYVRTGALLTAIDGSGEPIGVYAGSIAQHRGFRFVSGACRLLSRDVAERFLEDARDLGNSRYEDVEFELWARRHGFEHRALQGAGTVNVASIEAVDALSPAEIRATAHFRCNSPTPAGTRDDVRVMARLHERVVDIDRALP